MIGANNKIYAAYLIGKQKSSMEYCTIALIGNVVLMMLTDFKFFGIGSFFTFLSLVGILINSHGAKDMQKAYHISDEELSYRE